jgi:hypothetical protein
MQEPNRIPLTDNPRTKEPVKIPLRYYPETIVDDIWDTFDVGCGPPILAKQNENNQQNNTTSIQQLESDKIN